MLINHQRTFDKALVPHRQPFRFFLLKHRVALLKLFAEGFPLLHKTVFHVEHTPVDKLASFFRRTGQQLECGWINHLNRQPMGGFRLRGQHRAIQLQQMITAFQTQAVELTLAKTLVVDIHLDFNTIRIVCQYVFEL